MSDLRISCPRCGGSGQTSLDQTLEDCLEALREGTPATSKEINQRMAARGYGAGLTATNNQLDRLCRLGLAVRRGRAGKWLLYRLPTDPKTKSPQL